MAAEAPIIPPQADAERSGLRLRWTRIMPAVFVTYSLAYLDRANYGFGAAAGLARTLHISGSQSALLGALFFLGYFVPQIPGAAYARRHSACRLILVSLLGWGVFAALTGVIRNFWLLAADRLLLGVAESIVLPTMVILLTRWFTRAERSRANTLLILGNPITVLWMSAATGFLIHGIGWQRAFILEGLISVVWAVVWFTVVRDSPREARWMSGAATDALEQELAQEQASLPSVPNVRAAFRHRYVARLCLQYFFWSVGMYGFVLWLPVAIRSATADGMGTTGLLTAGPYLAAVLLMMLVSHLSDKRGRRRAFVWPFLVAAGVGLGGSYLTISHSFVLAYLCLMVAAAGMYAPYGPFWAMMPEMLPSNVAGEVIALVNSCGALGGFFGTYFVGLLQALTGSPQAGFLLMAVSLVASGVLLLGMRPLPLEVVAGRAVAVKAPQERNAGSVT